MKRIHIPCLVLCQFAIAVVSAEAATPAEQADAFFARGLAAEQRGDLVAVRHCYALALRISPAHTQALARLNGLETESVFGTETPANIVAIPVLKQGEEPTSSADNSKTPFIWANQPGAYEFRQHDFPEPMTIEACAVYWFTNGEVTQLPEYWKILYLNEDGFWMPVDAVPADPKADAWNVLRFTPVRTQSLRLVAQLKWKVAAGFIEWKILPSALSPTTPAYPKELRLDDLIPIDAKTEFAPYRVNRYNKEAERLGASVLLDGKRCDQFLFTHAGGKIRFAVPAGYTHFSSMAIGPTKAGRNNYAWAYRVLADDNPVFEGPDLAKAPKRQYAIEAELPPGTKTITLVADPLGNSGNDHAIWAYPKLTRSPISGETLARLAQLEAEFKSVGAAAAQAAHDETLTDLRTKYTAAVKRAQEEAKNAGDTATADVLQEELSRAQVGADVPEEDDPGTPAALVKLRGIYRQQAATAEKANAARMKPLLDRYDAELAALEASLTGKPDDLAAVKAARKQSAKQR